MKLAVALLLVLCTGCLAAIGSYSRAPSLCSRTNMHPHRVDVFLQDEERNTQRWGVAAPKEHVCAEWTLPGGRGRWGFGHPDGRVEWSVWFQASALRGNK